MTEEEVLRRIEEHLINCEFHLITYTINDFFSQNICIPKGVHRLYTTDEVQNMYSEANQFEGAIDNVIVSDKCITEEEVSELLSDLSGTASYEGKFRILETARTILKELDNDNIIKRPIQSRF